MRGALHPIFMTLVVIRVVFYWKGIRFLRQAVLFNVTKYSFVKSTQLDIELDIPSQCRCKYVGYIQFDI